MNIMPTEVWKIANNTFRLLLHFDMIDRVFAAGGKAGCWMCSLERLLITCLPFYVTFYDPIRASTQPLSIWVTASLLAAESMDEQKKFENSEVDALQYYLYILAQTFYYRN
jgi:hypothetical protein